MDKDVAGASRIYWVDMARGYGIILVIIGHLAIFDVRWCHLLSSEIYSFHMPLFFGLSGYLFNGMKYSPVAFFKRQVKRLLIPYFEIGLVICLINWLYYDFGDLNAIWKYARELIIQNRFHVIWYLTCLFVSEAVFYILVKITKNNMFILTVVTLILLGLGFGHYCAGGGALPWNIDVYPMAMAFIFAGYSLKNVELKGDFKYFILAVVINLICVAINEAVLGKNLEMFRGEYAVIPITFIGSLAGIYFTGWLGNAKHFAPIEYIGKHSLVYFGLHQAMTIPGCDILYSVLGWFPDRTNIWQGLGYITLTTLISLGVLTLLSKLIDWIRAKRYPIQA